MVSGVIRGHEVLTLPGDDPARRLKSEITRWYFPEVDSIVRLSNGVVAAIEPLDATRQRAITSFLERSDRIGARIGRAAEERLD